MLHKIHETYRKSLADQLAKWQKRRSRALGQTWLDAALILLNLNLDPLAESLDSLYSDSPRGRPPFDPVVMLRSLCVFRRS